MNIFATSIALVALSAAVGAQAQSAKLCITEGEVASLVVYAIPSAVEGIKTTCAPRLPAGGFLATEGDAFAARYSALRDARWAEAKSGFMKFGSRGRASEAEQMAVLANLPDDAVRPLVDAMISGQIAKSVAPADCVKVERGMQLLAGIDPAQAGALVAFTMALTKPKNPSICESPGTAQGTR